MKLEISITLFTILLLMTFVNSPGPAADPETARWIYLENPTWGSCNISHRNISLSPGWTKAGYTGKELKVKEVIKDLDGEITVMRYDGGNWEIYNNKRPEFLNTLTCFKTCWGYMIYSDVYQILEI